MKYKVGFSVVTEYSGCVEIEASSQEEAERIVNLHNPRNDAPIFDVDRDCNLESWKITVYPA